MCSPKFSILPTYDENAYIFMKKKLQDNIDRFGRIELEDDGEKPVERCLKAAGWRLYLRPHLQNQAGEQ